MTFEIPVPFGVYPKEIIKAVSKDEPFGKKYKP